MNKKLLGLVMIPAILVTLGSCGGKGNNKTPSINYQNALLGLKTGFKATGNLKSVTKYFEDEEHLVPSTKNEDVERNIESILTYTNTEDYVGVDYKYNDIISPEEKVYITADNMYDFDGHLAFNQIYYNNVLADDLIARDDSGNLVPYASNASINPFTLIFERDFDGVNLNQTKSNIAFESLFHMLDAVPVNVNVKPAKFTFKDDNLTNMSFESYGFNGVETIDYANYYTETIFYADFDVTEVGTANSKTQIAPEPDKKENDLLGEALTKLSRTSDYRINRHYKAKSNGVEVEEQETIDVYYNQARKAIYQAVYDGGPTKRPTEPTPADALYVDSPKDENKLLDAYMYKETSNPNEKKWQKVPELGGIDNLGEYKDFTLNDISTVSKDIFDINPDGSFTPIPVNKTYLAGDIFVPFLCTTSEIIGGYVTDFKLYLTDNYLDIDRIELTTSMGGIDAKIVISYDQIGTATIPFNALNNILE